MNYIIRINGTAPAWPAMLGQEHPFYDKEEIASLASTSYSILGYKNDTASEPDAEVLIDAGHETVPFLLRNGNRIPDALILTHGHPDHILGVDWIVQSLRFGKRAGTKMPVYCTPGTWKALIKSWGHIADLLFHHPLIPGRKVSLQTGADIELTPFPVYHGDGAEGAVMLFIEFPGSDQQPVIFTGDLLCPLVRRKDIALLSRAAWMFTDCNNRYPYPESNHISFSPDTPDGHVSQGFSSWLETKNTESLIRPHQHESMIPEEILYWEEFKNDFPDIASLPYSVMGLLQWIDPAELMLMHYFGYYDQQLFGEYLMHREELCAWAKQTAGDAGFRHTIIRAPKTGETFPNHFRKS
ncbi:MAG: MBL fold metallo-hydrolase [Bacteroidales bacterium]|nr:MBL fold metallo-hydrolase [Bacteroidales bacterium]